MESASRQKTPQRRADRKVSQNLVRKTLECRVYSLRVSEQKAQKRSEPEGVSRDERMPQRWEPQESSGSSVRLISGPASDALQREKSSEVQATAVRTAATR